MILLLLACHTPTWTDEGALQPHRARLDRDHDGRVTQAEYDRAAWNGPPFASADADADGDLSSAELLRLVRAQSATAFDQPGADPPLQRATAAFTPAPVAERDVEEVLVAMVDAVRSVGGPAPDAASLAAAVHSGSLSSLESRAVLEVLRPTWTTQGWAWPEGVP